MSKRISSGTVYIAKGDQPGLEKAFEPLFKAAKEASDNNAPGCIFCQFFDEGKSIRISGAFFSNEHGVKIQKVLRDINDQLKEEAE